MSVAQPPAKPSISPLAWVYIWLVLSIGALCIVDAGMTGMPTVVDWLPFLGLTILASAAQLFVVEMPNNHVAYFATPIFVFAGVLLLEPWQFCALIVIYLMIEWGKERLWDGHRLRNWYIQPFNIATEIIAGTVARWIYAQAGLGLTLLGGLATVLVGALAALVFVLVNHTLTGAALVLARKKTWRETGMLGLENVLSDIVLLFLGYVVAVLWELNPWLIMPALSPLVLMYRALRVPALEQEAQTDGKTGLLNPRYFNRKFEEEFARTRRFDRPLALIMADLDYLRNINNTYGHLAGDVVIAGIGACISRSIREYDFAGRFGGEEFAIVLPETGPVEANIVAERIRVAVETACFSVTTNPTPIRVTVSLGVACVPGMAQTTTELTHEADVAVYQAKAGGRNQVVGAPTHETQLHFV
jgi:diguanylate cyclase (GGDEF)-like protein